MTDKDIIRCDYCGDLMFVRHVYCRVCFKLNRQLTKGISHAETNQRGQIMTGADVRSQRV